jgi:hypothetical protein
VIGERKFEKLAAPLVQKFKSSKVQASRPFGFLRR